MTEHDVSTPWNNPGWLEEASAWIYAELVSLGYRPDGEIEQPHLRPWSTVLRVPTDRGNVFFKASAPTLAHEPALTAALRRWRPDVMPPVLATNTERGWMLMPDYGTPLRSIITGPQDLGYWEGILPLLAAVQIELADKTAELLALGALDRRLETLPAQFSRLLADTEAMRIDRPDSLTTAQYNQLLDLQPRFSAMCAQLAGYNIPTSLAHEDFHDANIFMLANRPIFTDWAESGVGHPFFTMLVTLRSIGYRLGLAQDASALARLRDVYLAAWSDYESPENLLAAFGLAYQIAMVCRSLTWHLVVAPLDSVTKEEYADAVPGWLQEFLEAVTAA